MAIVAVALFVVGFLMSAALSPNLNFGYCYTSAQLFNRIPCEFAHFADNPFRPSTLPQTIWNIDERTATPPFQLMAGGLALFCYAIFFLLFDVFRLRPLPIFATFGANTLASYFLHFNVNYSVRPWVPKDTPAAFLFLFATPFVFFMVWLGVKFLESKKIFISL